MQSQGSLRALVLADQPEVRAGTAIGEVEIGSVLDRQRRLRRLHPLQGALPVRSQDVRRVRPLRVGVLDQTVVARHQRPVAPRRGRKETLRILGLLRRALHQPIRQTLVPQRRAAELLRRPSLAVEARPQRQRPQP